MTTTGNFRYIDPESFSPNSKPWSKVDADLTSFKRKTVQKPVQNIRGRESEFSSVDTAGFAVYTYPSSVPSETFFTNDDQMIRTTYYKEIEEVLRSKLSEVKKIVIFDHTVRKREKDAPRQPVQQVHIDQTPRAAEVRVRRHLPESEAEELLKGRYQLINVWRPIGHPASDHPLAVIDWRSTTPADLVAVDLLYPKREAAGHLLDDDDRGKETLPDPESAQSTEGYEVKGETYSVAPSEKHQFFYYKDMTPNEVMFIKCYDAHSEGRPAGRKGIAALTPHTAFEDPATPAHSPGRQSIEVRCLVFYEQ
ncbi:MAG: hypothetical protein CYPHOPRED_004594 [Cyphobasidiales sp. Tagirdzhanova-0007]|nr:MAG: hypothetical protein CYPHOPRED_004594 [Cyphobasidiales sp. Tagirdzhanova-0007]